MTTSAMDCGGFTDRLMAYLEHETDDATRAALERHAATCIECGAVLADLRQLRAQAANLPALAPSRDLWSGIAERIEAPVVAIGSREAHSATPAWSRRTMRVALFAASLVAAAGLGYLWAGVGRGTDAPSATVAQAPAQATVATAGADTLVPAPLAQTGADVVRRPEAPVTAAAAGGAGARETPAATAALPTQLAVAKLTADYDREITRLRTLVDERRNQLDPATVAVIERNIQVIDAAILDSKKAIAADPSSAYLIEFLNQSLRTKVELMRTAATLPIRM